MYPLLFASIFGLVFIIERFWTLSRARTNVRALMGRVIRALREKGVQGGMEELERTRGPIAAILHSGLLRASYGPDAVEKAIETQPDIILMDINLPSQNGLQATSQIKNNINSVWNFGESLCQIDSEQTIVRDKAIKDMKLLIRSNGIFAIKRNVGCYWRFARRPLCAVDSDFHFDAFE